MDTLPLPLLPNLSFEYKPQAITVEYETSAKFEIIPTAIRNIPDLTLTIIGYIPKLYFLTLDQFFIDWDSSPFLWENLIWVATSYSVNYLNEGKAGDINLTMVNIDN